MTQGDYYRAPSTEPFDNFRRFQAEVDAEDHARQQSPIRHRILHRMPSFGSSARSTPQLGDRSLPSPDPFPPQYPQSTYVPERSPPQAEGSGPQQRLPFHRQDTLSPGWDQSFSTVADYDHVAEEMKDLNLKDNRRLVSYEEGRAHDTRNLQAQAAYVGTSDDYHNHNHEPPPPAPVDCRSKEDVYSRKGRLARTLTFLSIYSTLASGLWLGVAIAQPRYARVITTSGGGLTPENASLITTFIAKTIEMSFVAVFVAFIGQALTRRAISHKTYGVTLSEITMRNWVIQPGSMLTHWESIPYASRTTLGIMVIVATIATTFYITASDALVKPHLKFGKWEHQELKTHGRAAYGNILLARDNCRTPLFEMDPNEAGASCLNVEASGSCK